MMKAAEPPGSHVLTPRQRAILQFIEEYAVAKRLCTQRPGNCGWGGPERQIQRPLPPTDIESCGLPELRGGRTAHRQGQARRPESEKETRSRRHGKGGLGA